MFISTLRQKLVLSLFVFLLAFIPAKTAFGDSFNWAAKGSLFMFAANNGPGADSAPILGSLGFSLSWQIFDLLRVEFSEDIYFTNYEYNYKLGYPMACGQASRSAFVLGFITGVQAVGIFPIGEKGITARVFGGPAADFRIVTMALGLHPNDTNGDISTNAQLQTDAIRKYFWGKARWFMPVFGAGMDFPVTENYLIGFDLRVWFPMYKLWTDDNTPAIDGWRFGASLRITPRAQ